MTQHVEKSNGANRLRLVGHGPRGSVTLRFQGGQPAASAGEQAVSYGGGIPVERPGLEPTDPRWVLAVRTQQVLQGATLRPADRQELLRVGGVMGLNPFDANLVIAIVQDQARRGGDLQAAASSLSRVPLREGRVGSPMPWRVLRWCAAVLAAELLLIWAMF